MEDSIKKVEKTDENASCAANLMGLMKVRQLQETWLSLIRDQYELTNEDSNCPIEKNKDSEQCHVDIDCQQIGVDTQHNNTSKYSPAGSQDPASRDGSANESPSNCEDECTVINHHERYDELDEVQQSSNKDDGNDVMLNRSSIGEFEPKTLTENSNKPDISGEINSVNTISPSVQTEKFVANDIQTKQLLERKERNKAESTAETASFPHLMDPSYAEKHNCEASLTNPSFLLEQHATNERFSVITKRYNSQLSVERDDSYHNVAEPTLYGNNERPHSSVRAGTELSSLSAEKASPVTIKGSAGYVQRQVQLLLQEEANLKVHLQTLQQQQLHLQYRLKYDEDLLIRGPKLKAITVRDLHRLQNAKVNRDMNNFLHTRYTHPIGYSKGLSLTDPENWELPPYRLPIDNIKNPNRPNGDASTADSSERKDTADRKATDLNSKQTQSIDHKTSQLTLQQNIAGLKSIKTNISTNQIKTNQNPKRKTTSFKSILSDTNT